MEAVEFWNESEIRAALARRDISTCYRRLLEAGWTQQAIATCTGQAQSDVSAIVHGRPVRSYDVLTRIADGLNIPRGYLGLAGFTCPRLGGESDEQVDDMNPTILAHAGHVVTGSRVFGDYKLPSLAAETTPAPKRIGAADVAQFVVITDKLAALTLRHGGGAAMAALQAQTSLAHRLLEARSSDRVRHALLGAAALLHQRASSAAFDLGLLESARSHLLAALELVKDGQHLALQGYLLYASARVELYHSPPHTALQLLHLGYPAAVRSGIRRLLSLFEISQARVYAKLGEREASMAAIDTAKTLAAENQTGGDPVGSNFSIRVSCEESRA